MWDGGPRSARGTFTPRSMAIDARDTYPIHIVATPGYYSIRYAMIWCFPWNTNTKDVLPKKIKCKELKFMIEHPEHYLFDHLLIIDCRFAYEHNGGHIGSQHTKMIEQP
ncbi:positive regulation of cell cycle G2/M phase transition [Trichomonas vaginalis G3]|uniref:positive regulation of cell cycle G2/M phase transition n=1 Tax=Trichomonas vaginalis (strain ATCC PRA-98 / G3) TaxID=412133 RepID=UPI0021E53F22|nr:positive regulation of cell cycle G2/M phase transition [Trichomonas vaginalis G3]KAI5532644.1 positive regulation of cell cycle G2/M phase transition [Trichomonas vaginalis G3]